MSARRRRAREVDADNGAGIGPEAGPRAEGVPTGAGGPSGGPVASPASFVADAEGASPGTGAASTRVGESVAGHAPADHAPAAHAPAGDSAAGLALPEADPPEPPPFPGFVHRRVVVDVPASTANLGAGYDVLAMALDLANRVSVEVLTAPVVELTVEGEGEGNLPADRHNRFVVALELGIRWALGEVPAGIGWRVHMHNRIPLARGLGSSAAATVAGLVAADALTGGRLDQHRQLELACDLEGHPDNASSALLGGFVVVAMIGARPEVVRFDVPGRLRAVLFVPDRTLATMAMRAAIPRDVPHRDAVFNVGRAALAVAAITSGRLALLREATEDRLHEPYRAIVYPELPRLVGAAREAGALGACLSGAGSSVIAFADDERLLEDVGDAMASAAAEQGLTGRVRPVALRNAGPIVVEVG